MHEVHSSGSYSDTFGNKKVSAYHHYLTAVIDLTAGSFGGIANVLVGQPLDTVKVKMQTFPHLYSNSFQCFKQTVQKEKIRGLYAGTVPALVANVAENSVVFCAYGVCQNFVQLIVNKKSKDSLNPLENAFAGFFAAFFSSFTLCPTELIKCRLQAMREMSTMRGGTDLKQVHISPWELTRDVLRSEGIPGLFRGLSSTFAREMPGYFFFFGGYEISRTLLTPQGKTKDEIGLVRTIISGGIGGVALWVAIFPADVVKSRIQVATSKESVMTVVRHILHTEGFRGFYKGLGPTVLRTFPSTGALFVAYEYTKKSLHYLTGTDPHI